ncbi:glutathione S-transferase family protein [Lonepinella sp. BR2357]|uniref:glutathione S-transferase family protein n=1 Tax=Lonepinella sp. BR2357 TaxID=3434549 RepID=UPI003F6E3ED9
MLTLHHLNNSRSLRILWLLTELKNEYGLEFELVQHQRQPNFFAPDSLAQIHPTGKAPILVDEGKVMVESGFIIEYLLRYYDKQQIFLPTDDESWQAYHFWLHFGESSMMPPLVMRLVFSGIVKKSPFFIRPITKSIQQNIEKLWLTNNINQNIDLLEQALQKSDYLADKFTGADIQVYFAAKAIKEKGGLTAKHSHIEHWLACCEARDSYIQAVQMGGALNFS